MVMYPLKYIHLNIGAENTNHGRISQTSLAMNMNLCDRLSI